MPRYGFIHDKLDIKILILFITSYLAVPVPMDIITDLTMCDDGIDYFAYAECLSELVESGHLSLSEDDLYQITNKGLSTSEICKNSLPYSVRLKVERNIQPILKQVRRNAMIKTRITPRENGTFTVYASLEDGIGEIMKLEMMASTNDYAKRIETNFRQHAEKIYNRILDAVLDDYLK